METYGGSVRVAVVTGAGRGIGQAIAVHMAQAGYSVAVNYPNDADGPETTMALIAGHAGRAVAIRADLTREADRRLLFEETLAAFGRVDVLVNNAGVDPGNTPLLTLTEEDYDGVVGVNFKAGLFCARLAAATMIEAGQGGRIIFIGSIHSRHTVAARCLYAPSKGAVESLTRSLAVELGPHGITVNAISPGLIEVERTRNTPGYEAEAVSQRIPVRRVGRPDDISSIVCYLAGNASGFLTGQIILVDGGVSCQLASYREPQV